MRVYFEIARRTAQRVGTYRGAMAAGVFTNTAFALLNVAVLAALYRGRGSINGFDLTDAITFTFCAQGLLATTGMFGDMEMAERIRSGDVVIDFYRPVDVQGYWLADSYGKAACFALFRAVPPIVAGGLLFDLRLPSAPARWLAFVAAVVLAVAVSFGVRFLVQSCAYWILDIRGPNQVVMLVAQFLSGMFIPVLLFPDWLRDVAMLLPFAGQLQYPAEVFVGKHVGADLLGVFALQLLWVAALLLLGRLVLRRAVHKVVVQGG